MHAHHTNFKKDIFMPIQIKNNPITTSTSLRLEMSDTGGAFVSLYFVVPGRDPYVFRETYSGKMDIKLDLPKGTHQCQFHVFAFPDGAVSPTVNSTLKIDGKKVATLSASTPAGGGGLHESAAVTLVVA